MRLPALAFLFVLHAADARAESQCAITLTPDEASKEWRAAVASLRADLRHEADGDCRAIAIDVSADPAFVVLTTQDGRQAVRRIDSPEDLRPLVDALLVTLPAPSTSDAIASTGQHPETAAAPPIDHAQSAADKAMYLVVQADGGARVSAPGGFASPSFGARLGAVFGRWELACTGQWDPAHTLLSGGTPAGFSMSRYAVGVAAGRRLLLGESTIALGLTTAVAVVSEVGIDNGGPSAGQTGGATSAEPLVGAYVAFVWPHRSSLRFRSELSGDAVASRLGKTLVMDPSLPALPWWSATTTLGVEWVVP
jgi:hypothetical protein